MNARLIRTLTLASALTTALAATALGPAAPAWAQGCIVMRNNQPVFGDSSSLPTCEKEWQVYLSYRGSTADRHYNGTVEQEQRQDLRTNVVNDQRLIDMSATYVFSQRLSLSASVPLVDASWSIPLPVQTTGERSKQEASGIGDVSVSARYWMLDPVKHPRGNWSAGIGVKAPTGEYDAEDSYPDISGGNTTRKAVDQSIQPGDGGWGVLFSFQGYKQVARTTFFGSGTYLANPRDTNGTPSIVQGLIGSNPAFADLLVNSVPDQYLARVGVSVPLFKQHLSGGLAFRAEGVPRYDLFGGSHGWRRPGYETYAEPGLTYSYGLSSWSIYVPIGLVRNRRPNPYTGTAGDATFPDHVVLVGYSYRFPNRAATPHDESR